MSTETTSSEQDFDSGRDAAVDTESSDFIEFIEDEIETTPASSVSSTSIA